MRSLILALPADAALDSQTWLRFALTDRLHKGPHRGQQMGQPNALAEPGQEPAQDGGQAQVADLPTSDELVLVLPAQRLSWHRLALPRVPRARLAQALAGLLEERVLSEPAQLHFAVAPDAAAGQPSWIAVCDKGWLQHALQCLEAAGRPVSRIVPSAAPLPPVAPARWQVQGTPDAAWLLRQGDDGVQCLPLDGDSALWLQMNAAGTQAEPAVAALAEQLSGAPVAVCSQAQALCQAAAGPWNLAQFELTLRHQQRWLTTTARQWRLWRAAPAWRPLRWGLVACAVAQAVGLNAWAWQERATLQARQAALGQVLKQYFPALPVIDPVLQMEREVLALRRSTGTLAADDLESLLAGVAREAPGLSAATRLRYQAQTLTLGGLSGLSEPAAELGQRLAKAGYSSQFKDGELTVQLTNLAKPLGPAP